MTAGSHELKTFSHELKTSSNELKTSSHEPWEPGVDTRRILLVSDSPTCWMENFENLSENLKVSPKKFSLSFDFIDVTPCLAYVRGNQHEAGCHVMKSNESRKLLRRNFEVFLKFSKFSIQQVGERFNKECQPQVPMVQ